MSDNAKRILLIAFVVCAIGLAIYSGNRAISSPKEEVVGELSMPAGGGRDAERGRPDDASVDAATGKPVADQASGMPADMIDPP